MRTKSDRDVYPMALHTITPFDGPYDDAYACRLQCIQSLFCVFLYATDRFLLIELLHFHCFPSVYISYELHYESASYSKEILRISIVDFSRCRIYSIAIK